MFNFIFSNLKYPKTAQKAGAAGTVVAKFVVSEDGSLENPTIVRSVHEDCDKEVLRVINEMPLWEPAQKDGKAVASVMHLPVKFVFDEDDTANANTTQAVENASDKLQIEAFKAYPNPATESFTYSFRTNEEIVEVKINDASGNCIHNVNYMNLERKDMSFDSELVEVKGLAKGTLFITLSNEKGDKVVTEKIIIQ